MRKKKCMIIERKGERTDIKLEDEDIKQVDSFEDQGNCYTGCALLKKKLTQGSL